MSESDSDLDYASADEDANCDASAKNNNMDKVNYPDVNNESVVTPGQPLQIMSAISEAPNSESLCKEDSKTDPINIENTQVITAHDNDCSIPVNEISSVKDCIKDDPVFDMSVKEKTIKNDSNDFEGSKITLLDKPVNEEKEDKLVNKNVEDSVPENTTNKVYEKQRVPLRLEKKIQQKQQASKEELVDKDEIKTTEFLAKKPEVKVFIILNFNFFIF